ncbi:MAG: ABC transporter ATP-binding protein [archaeon]|jgi:putative ABC transport system ATP-binding protein|nr:ABC transporter ATP-binding protein [archaeon]MDD2477863.1 ABC transporter ATP-binding protein [Candidatus ainarchaeum sp.]MDD3084598.1 ABC transporter ATP-binding protein [Candidatus ainarchaeum sp.]MDD4221113.1 ABC transporter ATP-binding protein [Candidatus ainarchaeum sp.]MDD4662600.1 ABC transporter ATP-binding protein [Candidatus ainarchaeum sp.]
MKRTVVELKNVSKIYEMGEIKVKALDGVSLKIMEGELVSIMGPSGSGKSTMMHIIGALDLPTSGEIYIDNNKLSKLTEDQLAKIRGKTIGFVFQEFNLIPTLTAFENVKLPTLFQDERVTSKKEQYCKDLLTLVGLGDRMDHKPTELSGGQQQRVAIARSLANNPAMILADEPTGALDSKSSKEIMQLLKKLNKEGKTVIIITHDDNVSDYTNRKISLKDGKIVEDKTKKK